MGKSVEFLTPDERVAYYRGMAAESLRLSHVALDTDAISSFVTNAAQWTALAKRVERLANLPINPAVPVCRVVRAPDNKS